ncbi:hypothetical protein BN11_820007 [Nostocoides australiense Ben110]|uniref:Uncharacterized protein n=1 Tax=Nostocoides australiense Ben110 TaxID=1193182 RepID=W6K4T7_9MICO|nr:hypothetical protein BN11_820007 [Tetrasphaera australiensis Ben110]
MMSPLTRTEAQQRATTIRVSRMAVALDLDQGPETFGSRAEIHFEPPHPRPSSTCARSGWPASNSTARTSIRRRSSTAGWR